MFLKNLIFNKLLNRFNFLDTFKGTYSLITSVKGYFKNLFINEIALQLE